MESIKIIVTSEDITLYKNGQKIEKKDFIKKMRLLFPIFQKKEANEAEKSWEWLQPWTTMKW